MIQLRSRKVILNKNLVPPNGGSTSNKRFQETTGKDTALVENKVVSLQSPMSALTCEIIKEDKLEGSNKKKKQERGLSMKRSKSVQNAEHSECLGCKKMVRAGTAALNSKTGRRVGFSELQRKLEGSEAKERICCTNCFVGLSLPQSGLVEKKGVVRKKYTEKKVTGKDQLEQVGRVKRRSRMTVKLQMDKGKTRDSEKMKDNAIKSSVHLKQKHTLHVRIKKSMITSETDKRVEAFGCESQQRERDPGKKQTFLSDHLDNRNVECHLEERKDATTSSNLTMKLRSSTKRKRTSAVQDSNIQMSQTGINVTALGKCIMENSLGNAHKSHSISEDSVDNWNQIGIIKAKCLRLATQETYNKTESTSEYKERQCNKTSKYSVSLAYPLEKSPVVTPHSCSSLEKFLKHSECDLCSSSYKIFSEFRDPLESLLVQKRKDASFGDRTRENDVEMRPLVAQTAGGPTTADKPDLEGNTERKCESVNNNSRLRSGNRQNKHSTKLKWNTGRKSVKQMVALCKTETSLGTSAESVKGVKHNEVELQIEVRQPNKSTEDKYSSTVIDQTNPAELTLGVLNSCEREFAASVEYDRLMLQNMDQNEQSASSNVEVQMKTLDSDIFEKWPGLLHTKEQGKSLCDSKAVESESREPVIFGGPIAVTMKDPAADSAREQGMEKASIKHLKSKKEFQIGCRRIFPMIGKNAWKSRSCARTNQWSFPKRELPTLQKKTCSQIYSQDSSHENFSKDTDAVPTEDQQRPGLTLVPEKEEDSSRMRRKLDGMVQALSSDACKNGTLHEDGHIKPRVDQDGNKPSTIQNMVSCVPDLAHITNTMSSRGTDNSEHNEESALGEAHNKFVDQQTVKPMANDIKKNIGDLGTSVVREKLMIPELDTIVNTVKLPNLLIPVHKSSEPKTLLNSKNLDHGSHNSVELYKNLSTEAEMQNSINEQHSSGLNLCSQFCNAETCNVDATSLQDSMVQSFHKNSERTVSQNHSDQVDCVPLKLDFVSTEPTFEREFEPSTSKNIVSVGIPGKQKDLQPFFAGDTCSHDPPSYTINVESVDREKMKSKNYADVYKAYEDDVLVLDVIQDDPDLFGGSPCDESKSQEDSMDSRMTRGIKYIHKENEGLPVSHELELEASNFRKYSPKCPGHNQRGGAADFNQYCGSIFTANQMKRQDSSPLGSGSVGGHTEESEEGQLTQSEDCKSNFDMNVEEKFPEKTIALKDEKTNICELQKRENSKYLGFLRGNLADSNISLQSLKGQPDGCKLPLPWMDDFRFTNKPSEHLPLQNSSVHEAWKIEKNSLLPHQSCQPVLKTTLPAGYCNFYFNTLRGCLRQNCWFLHVPKQGDEKFCMEIIHKLVSTNNMNLLQRAVQIFTNYYRTVPPGIHYDPDVQSALLLSLLNCRLLQDLFLVLNIGVIVKILPSVEILLKVFEQVRTAGLRNAAPCLVDIFCKLVEADMILPPQHFYYICKLLNEMHASESEINLVLALKNRVLAQESKKNSLCDLDLAIAEIEHCKERADWVKLGTLYVNISMGCQNLTDLKRFSTCVADALTKDSKDERSVVPFCDFAETVSQGPNHNGVDKNLLGRIGISVIYSYHKCKQWIKGRKVLDKLHKMQIDFTTLKGLTGPESLASRCQVVNVAVEIFLKSGTLDGAIWVLKESEWIISTSLWPCDKMDILNRHNLLCTIADETLAKSLYGQAFEVLQNLPGLQETQDAFDVSQYSALFNQLLNSCIENISLGMSSSVVDFMISKNIPVNFSFFRGLITALGRSCLWLRARSHYKSALSLGIYPPLEGNLYRKILHIPSYMSEVEMLLAIEIFMVSNASNIQSPGGSSQTFQIVLKRCVEDKLQSKDDYRTATERLILAVRLSTPKLFIKHMTMNVAMEQVYILDHSAALKWLKENMKWAGKVWLFQ